MAWWNTGARREKVGAIDLDRPLQGVSVKRLGACDRRPTIYGSLREYRRA
jgi:hypothetical protein